MLIEINGYLETNEKDFGKAWDKNLLLLSVSSHILDISFKQVRG